jgi:NitT/TauT family transport system substrate-binding protein
MSKFVPVLALSVLLAACGEAAAPTGSSPAAPVSTPASATAKPASAPASASAKPAASAAASGSAQAASGTKLQTAYSEIYNGQVPIWVAQDAGLFKQAGLEVDQTYVASSNVIAAIISGQVPIAQGGGPEALSAAANGADLMFIGNVVPVYPYIMYVSKDVTSLADLKGKKLGVSSHGSASDIATRVALKKEGLDPDKDVNIVTVGSSTNRTAALQSGAIQGGMDQPPSSYQLEKQGLHPLIDMASLKLPTVNNGIIVQGSWLKGHRAEAQKYIDGVVQGVARTKNDRAYAAQELAKYMKLDNGDDIKRAIDYGAENLWASQPTIKKEDFADAVAVLSDTNPKVKDFDVSKILDNSLVESAIQRGLDK